MARGRSGGSGGPPGYTRSLPIVLGGAAILSVLLALVAPWAGVWVSAALFLVALLVMVTMEEMRGEVMTIALGLTLFATIISVAVLILVAVRT